MSLVPNVPTSLRNIMRGSRTAGKGKFSGLKPIRASITTNDIGVAGSAASALVVNQTITLTTGNFPELSSFMVVYDLMRIVRGRVRYLPAVNVTGSGLAFGACCALADQTAGNPTSVSKVREETHSSTPYAIAGSTAFGIQNPSKFQVLPFEFKTHIAPVGTNTNPGDGWFVLDTNNAPHVVQVQAYHTPLTTTGVTQFSYYVELDCEFKMRT